MRLELYMASLETSGDWDYDTELAPEAGLAFCALTGDHDPVTGWPLVVHADPCGCATCAKCGLVAPFDLGWLRTLDGDFICPADQDEDESAVAF